MGTDFLQTCPGYEASTQSDEEDLLSALKGPSSTHHPQDAQGFHSFFKPIVGHLGFQEL